MTVEKIIAEVMEEFAKTFEGVSIDYSVLMQKVEKAGPGVELVTVPRFIQRAVMMAYQAGLEAKNDSAA